MSRKSIEKFVGEHFESRKNNGAIPVSGKIFGKEELSNLVEASLEGWWTEGKWTEELEDRIKKFVGVKFAHTCNSGSSANLLAFAALCSKSLGNRRIKKGDEVITLAAGFPTTINPIIQLGCIPVFVDIEIPTYNIDVNKLKKALTKKTKAVMIAHTLGNPFNLDVVLSFCKENKLWLIEDNCDALGSKYDDKYTGTFGDISTLSFYPAHHITTAEGGAVLTDNPKLSKIIVSIRDWGRHCWCKTGRDNTCNNRYEWQHGDLPYGYDHKYIYSEIGYNLKLSDLHAAIGVAQIKRLPKFVQKRKDNFQYLRDKFKAFEDYFILPEATKGADPSWFGFLITIKSRKINREELLKYLEKSKIGTRLLFGGNIIKQPYLHNNNDIKFRIVGELTNTDIITNKTFWIGVYPGISKSMIDQVVKKFREFINQKINTKE